VCPTVVDLHTLLHSVDRNSSRQVPQLNPITLKAYFVFL
jgi:hypothetical protein